MGNGYKVIGSVRSESKGKELTDIIQSNDFQFAVIPDISAVGAFDDVLKSNLQISVFIHTASQSLIRQKMFKMNLSNLQ